MNKDYSGIFILKYKLNFEIDNLGWIRFGLNKSYWEIILNNYIWN